MAKHFTCPVCLEYFTEPVSLECGHNFCRACISQSEWCQSDLFCCVRGQGPARVVPLVPPGSLLKSPRMHSNVTLDPDTAHPQLILSEDRKSVRWRDTRQQLSKKPERFDTAPCVLGCEGFTSGRHCWEVEVGAGGSWAVGVAKESVKRKGGISLSPDGGIWAVGQWEGQFQALISPVTPLPRAPSRIRVCLDCDRGQVTFIDAGDKAPIFTFPSGSVPGGRIRPWIWVWKGSRLSLTPGTAGGAEGS
uniref:Uncharacterized protein n=1 Tax=Chelonoidis abingdonii TaxID=106734 RepID=A0A8C0H020_CHEAB